MIIKIFKKTNIIGIINIYKIKLSLRLSEWSTCSVSNDGYEGFDYTI